MGSVGISTGRVFKRQIDDILDGRVTVRDKQGRSKGLPDVIRVYASHEPGKAAFTINMRGVDKSVKQGFLRFWSGQNLDVKNAESSARKAERDAKNQGKSDEEAKRIGERARVMVTTRAMKNILARDKASGNNIYDGITISGGARAKLGKKKKK